MQSFHKSLDNHKSSDVNESVDFSPRITSPSLEVIRASKHFFSSPGLSNSLMEEARLRAALYSSTSRPADVSSVSCSGGTAVVMASRDPYDDFRQSMVEMMMAHHADVGVGVVDRRGDILDWDFMQELLLSYLELNDRSVHEDILQAFADVTVDVVRRGRL